MKLGVLTGGGDCPGLNAAIRAVVKRSADLHDDCLGIKNGWSGLVHGVVEPLTVYSVTGILPKGGTILGTSRTNPLKHPELVQKARDNWRRFGLEAVIAIGGEDTLSVAKGLQALGLNCVGIPKTIDNDLAGTEVTFGFDTAVSIATEAIDRLHSTAEAHHRVMVVEVMGRNTGWIATKAGIAGGADCVLIPERPFDFDAVCALVKRRLQRGKEFSIVVVAEGARPKDRPKGVTQDDSVDEFGHVRLGGIGTLVGREIEKRTGIETRVTILGHVQRGGTPTATDRELATRFGVGAVEAVHAGKFGHMVALQATKIVTVPFETALSEPRVVDPELYRVAEVFFG